MGTPRGSGVIDPPGLVVDVFTDDLAESLTAVVALAWCAVDVEVVGPQHPLRGLVRPAHYFTVMDTSNPMKSSETT